MVLPPGFLNSKLTSTARNTVNPFIDFQEMQSICHEKIHPYNSFLKCEKATTHAFQNQKLV
jgi:hypothetical protein